MEQESNGYGVILATFAVCYVLAIVPLPQWLLWGRPEWVALTLIYWVIALPHRVGITTAIAVGVGLDVLEGAALGQNAAALAVVAILGRAVAQTAGLLAAMMVDHLADQMVPMVAQPHHPLLKNQQQARSHHAFCR